jgi:methylated-DNA-[protein]-cysteine S-methyltransferase
MELMLQKRFGVFQVSEIKDLESSRLADQLHAYFAGDLMAVAEIAVDLDGTPFQQRVWSALRKIPVGETTSYGKLASKIGYPGSARAVGTANGLNPVAIIVPCHRVIGSDGALRGYAGGVERKRWLLSHELKHSKIVIDLTRKL